MLKTKKKTMNNQGPWETGKQYFIRTVTYYFVGRMVQVTDHELVIEDAAWIADTGRYTDALKSGVFSEVEPYPAGRVIIGRGALIDASEYRGKLPLDQK